MLSSPHSVRKDEEAADQVAIEVVEHLSYSPESALAAQWHARRFRLRFIHPHMVPDPRAPNGSYGAVERRAATYSLQVSSSPHVGRPLRTKAVSLYVVWTPSTLTRSTRVP